MVHSPHLPIELTEVRTCSLIIVTHDTPAAMALYAMSSNQAPLHPILHPPTGLPRVDAILAHQPLLVTHAPGSPPATTRPRPAVACTAFTSRTPAESWQLLKRALALELRNILAKKANEDQLRTASNPDQLPQTCKPSLNSPMPYSLYLRSSR